jgi:hypothetical protein
VAALLTSDVYGLRSQLDPQTLQELDRKRELDAKEQLTEVEKRESKALTSRLMGLDLSKTARDPLYKPFVKAMAKAIEEEGLNTTVLSSAQQARQNDLALDIIKRLRSQQGKSDASN